MPILSNTLFTGLADRVAKQAEILSTAVIDAQVEGGGFFYPRVHEGVVTAGNFGVENTLISAANGIDINNISGTEFNSVYNDFINALEAHVIAEGASSIDSFLNTSGINVDPYFEEVFFQSKGSHLLARNTFLDTQIEMGTVDITSSGVGTFTDQAALGTGTGTTAPGNHAAAQLHAVPQGTIGANDVVLAVQLLEEAATDGSTATSKNVTIPSGTGAGVLFSIGTSGVDFFLDVTDVIIAGGAASDQVKFLNVAGDRVRAL